MANGNDPANISYIIAENGFYYVAYKEKVKVPEIVVSAKGVANGLSEEYNDGWDFGPDSYDPDSTASIPYTQTSGIQEAWNYVFAQGGGTLYQKQGFYDISNAPFQAVGDGSYTQILLPANPESNPMVNITWIVESASGGSLGAMPLNSFKGGTTIYSNAQTSGTNTFILASPYISSDSANPNNNLNLTIKGMLHVQAHAGNTQQGGIYFQYLTQLYADGLYADIDSSEEFPSTINSSANGIFIGQGAAGDLQYVGLIVSAGYHVGLAMNSAHIYIGKVISDFNQTGISLAGTPYASYIGQYVVENTGYFISGSGGALKIGQMEIGDNNLTGYPWSYSYIIADASTASPGLQIDADVYFRQSGITPAFSITQYSYINLHNRTPVFQALTPTLSANPPASGTVYQNTNPYAIEIDLPVYATTAGTAGYVTIAKGATDTPTAIGNQFVNGSTSSTSVDIIRLRVPAGWYYEFTASGVTFGTASVFAD